MLTLIILVMTSGFNSKTKKAIAGNIIAQVASDLSLNYSKVPKLSRKENKVLLKVSCNSLSLMTQDSLGRSKDIYKRSLHPL